MEDDTDDDGEDFFCNVNDDVFISLEIGRSLDLLCKRRRRGVCCCVYDERILWLVKILFF